MASHLILRRGQPDCIRPPRKILISNYAGLSAGSVSRTITNVRVVLINPPPPQGCFARGSLGAGSGARVVIINLWPCPGTVVPVVIVVRVVIVGVIITIAGLSFC